MSNINTFISKFKGLGARPNRFRINITWPALVGTPNISDEIVIKTAGMPASGVGTAIVPFMGLQVKLPGDRVFEDWTVSVINATDFSHRNAFERWLNAINAHRENVSASLNLADLVATIDIYQLGLNGEVLKTVKLYNAFPNNVSQIDLGYDQNDIISEFMVTFSYSHWESVDTPTT